jgi:ABC-2 type transport system ATP-binding protein
MIRLQCPPQSPLGIATTPRSVELPTLRVSDLHKSYGQLRAVRGIGFTIDAGEIFGLLGPNGAGKTTTINIVATLLQPDRGAVVINDAVRSTDLEYKRRLGYVPQEISLAEKLTARENLLLVGRLYDLGGADLRQRVAEALSAVGLTDRASDLVRTYSGGMKRRLNIAAALLHESDLLLMDEPTTGVDPQARAFIYEVIERLARQGRAILYTTHYMEEAQRLCHRTAILDQGEILAMGTLTELIQGVRAKRDLVIEAPGLSTEVVDRLARRLGGVSWKLDEGAAHLEVADPDRSLMDALRAADQMDLRPTAISIQVPNLQTVFLELTGRALRD